MLVDYLGIGRVIVPVLVDGHGTVRCQHGIIPVPVPATVNICTAHGLPLAPSDVEGELVTPTGAALVAALQPEFKLPERYAVRAIGQGSGKRTYSRPSILRAMLIDDLSSPHTPSELSTEIDAPHAITKLECDIDDASPEVLAYAAERLREAGAREVHWLPIFCKKGRPGVQLQVIASNEDVERLQDIMFQETTTVGVRRQRMERTVLPRSFEQVDTPWGAIQVKVAVLPDGVRRATPEYEDCAQVAREQGIPVQQVMQDVLARYNAVHR